METIIHNRGFNVNEWYTIAIMVLGLLAVWLLPRRFPPTAAAFNLMIGIVFGLMFDHTLGVPPIDLYDVGDSNKYSVFDLFSYLMYAPAGYLFIYFYDRFHIRGFITILYIAGWAALGIATEWLGVLFEVFHYKQGYKLIYSFPIYLILESIHLGIYRLLYKRQRSGKDSMPLH